MTLISKFDRWVAAWLSCFSNIVCIITFGSVWPSWDSSWMFYRALKNLK